MTVAVADCPRLANSGLSKMTNSSHCLLPVFLFSRPHPEEQGRGDTLLGKRVLPLLKVLPPYETTTITPAGHKLPISEA